MSEGGFSPLSSSSASLKRKRPAVGDYIDSKSRSSTSQHMDEPIKSDDDGVAIFTTRAMQLLRLSTAPSEFLDHLSSAVDHILSLEPTISPESLATSLSNIVPHNPDLPNQILDIINLFWTDRSGDDASRLKALLQALIQENVLTIDVAIELLDKSILQDADIISNSQILATRSARINTGLLYKQQKFNLLREENEGYAKLSHEFNLALSELPKGGLIDEFEIAAKSDELLTVVNALIGYFELDPNRVFDNILDICSQNLLSHVRFVLHFLHRSPWAPSTLAASRPFSSLSVNEKRQCLELIRRDLVGYYKAEEYNNGGSKLAARLLGFKFRYYAASSEDDVKSQPSPEPLVFMTALLIKSGFVKLSDLYLYLDPADDATADEYRKWKDEMDEKAFLAKSNPLALAGALGDGENAEDQISQAMEVSDLGKITPRSKSMEQNQKAFLLHALLAVGCIPAALQLLSLHPQISAPYVSISDGIHRLLHISIQFIYSQFSPSRLFQPHVVERLELQKKRAAPGRSTGGTFEWLEELERKSVRGYSPFPKQEFGNRNVRFFLDDDFWTDDIPICETMDDFFAIVVSFLRFSGPRLGHDISLLVKLARLGKGELAKEGRSPSEINRWVELARQSLIPAISLVGANPGVVNELYDLIRLFPAITRFSLYGEWQAVAYKSHPDLKLRASETDKDTKGILRRISKQDVKRFGRALAKISTSNPLIVWAISINQIEYYDNFVDVVVDAAKFCTHLGYDVLEYVILSSLANPFKNRVKDDGTSIALWLTGLSTFCAKLFRRYAYMDVSMATLYIACQLKRSNIYDLVVLRDLVTQMAGILVRENLSDHQLRCYAGGDTLKEQAMALLREPGTNLGWKKSGSRLLNGLLETNLVGLFVVLIAQERATSLFKVAHEHNSNLKLLGNLFDECHGVLVQFHEYIVSNLDLVSFEKLMPSFVSIVKEFGIEPAVAFYTWRPILTEKIRQYDVDKTIELQKKKLLRDLANNDKTNDVPGDVLLSSLPEAKSEMKEKMPNVTSDTSENSEGLSQKSIRGDIERPWHPALSAFIEDIAIAIPEEVWDFMSPQFYATFWQLSLYDILVPVKAYTQEAQKLTSEIKNIDRPDLTAAGLRRRRERERLQALVDQLNQEFKSQTAAYQSTKQRLSQEKDFWFDWSNRSPPFNLPPPRNKTVLAILQHCVIPRCVFGPNEAIFAARFLREMHRLGTKNFSSLTLFDKIFVGVHESVIFTCTNREAENYGRFLREVLSELTKWYSDKSIYEKEAIGPNTPGFMKKWNTAPSEATYLQFEEYRSVMFKWHRNMTTAFKNCLESRDYMHVRNALAVLEKISGHYPLVDIHATALEEKVSTIAGKSETRGDLQVRAQGYLALLKKSAKSCVTSAKFTAQSTIAPSTVSQTPSSSTAISSAASDGLARKTTLNPSAASFTPQQDIIRKPDDKPDSRFESSISSKRTPGHSTNEAHESVKEVIEEKIHQQSESTSSKGGSSSHSTAHRARVDDSRFSNQRVERPLQTLERRSRPEHPEAVQQKVDDLSKDRSSRPRDDSTIVSSEKAYVKPPISFQQNPSKPGLSADQPGRREEVVQGPISKSEAVTIAPTGPNQGRDFASGRPRTPDGPRSSSDHILQPDLISPRQLRYDANRSNLSPGVRVNAGFRAPPPTGPRSNAVPGMMVPPNINLQRQAHIPRPSNFEALRTAPTAPSRSLSTVDRPEELKSLSKVIVNPDRRKSLRDLAVEQRSSNHSDTRPSRSRAAQSDVNEAPKGPSDWRHRSVRDLQDDDPRRLTRGPDSWSGGGFDMEQSYRGTEENIQTGPAKAEITSSNKARVSQQSEERIMNEPAKTTRDSPTSQERNPLTEGNRPRVNGGTDNFDSEFGRRRGDHLARQQSDRISVSGSRNDGAKILREEKGSLGDRKEMSSLERRTSREELFPASRDSKDKDQRLSSYKDVDLSRRKEDHEISTRNKKDDPRQERSKEGHHGRIFSRHSPSKSHSDRSEKREKEKEGDRRSAPRRESKDAEHHERDRMGRDTDYRRDGRDRDHSVRDRESDGRRGSRKHERERESDAVSQLPSGEVGEDAGGSSLLPNKRRRVGR